MKNSSQKSKNSVPTLSSNVTLGKVLKPRGLSGEVKCQILTNKPEAFSLLPNIEKISFSGEFAFIRFKGTTTIEAAEALRGSLIQIPRDKLPLDEDEIIADDIIGFDVLDEDGKRLGTVHKIEAVGAGEVIDCGHFMFPYEDEFVVETNMRHKRLIIRAAMLEEEVVL